MLTVLDQTLRLSVRSASNRHIRSALETYWTRPDSVALKALVWFWLIDETLSANLVYQDDYEIGSTTPSDEANKDHSMMIMIP